MQALDAKFAKAHHRDGVDELELPLEEIRSETSHSNTLGESVIVGARMSLDRSRTKVLRGEMSLEIPFVDRGDIGIPYSLGEKSGGKRAPRSKKPTSGKFRLLDLFCCAGGAGVGYARAGFEIVGVDITPQPNYPFSFIQSDALKLDPGFIKSFDAIHASPPCQSYSDLAKRNRNADEWPRLIEPVREMLVQTGLPYIIENVDGAPLLNPVVLCGTMFPGLRVLRHRLFEANFEIVPPAHRKHPRVHTFDKRKSHFGKTNEWKDFVQVTGGGNCTLAAAREAMGIDWMTKGEINESIPPAYTEFIGRQLLRHLANVEHASTRRRG
jgi:DNA (cytosine-5)-methyltransferase 1